MCAAMLLIHCLFHFLFLVLFLKDTAKMLGLHHSPPTSSLSPSPIVVVETLNNTGVWPVCRAETSRLIFYSSWVFLYFLYLLF